MPFKHFLATSLDFERTHQLIVRCLLNERAFLKRLTGIDTAHYQVVLEPISGLFDIGIIGANNKAICLLELKMWSGLSNAQLERQRKHLEDQKCVGLHILLGTSDLQFHKDPKTDEISEKTGGHSRKVGYEQLIAALNDFIKETETSLPSSIIASDYSSALQKQAEHLDRAWLAPKVNPHFRCYSAYSKIKRYLTDENFHIYSVNNAGGAAYILNDSDSWTRFKYKGYDFMVYQEMLDLQIMIRIYGEGSPNSIKNELKSLVIQELSTRDKFPLTWSFESKSSKYHKIAIYRPPLNSLNDCQSVAEVLKFLNPTIKDIVAAVQDKN